MAQRDSAKEETMSIKNNMQLYKMAFDLATEYYKGNTKYTSIGDALSRGLVDVYLCKQSKLYVSLFYLFSLCSMLLLLL